MKRIAISFLFAASFSVVAEECPSIPKNLENAVIQHIQTIRASEYCEARSVQSNKTLSVVIYTAEGECGSNSKEEPGTCSVNWVRYMVGEYNGKIIGPVSIGGKGNLSDTQVKISGGVVEISGLTIGANDALCCPSVSASKKYRVAENGFQEILP